MCNFVPTDEQRKTASHLLSHGISGDRARLKIINPRTNKPIDKDTFYKVFAREVELAGLERTGLVVDRLYEKALEGDVGAISKYLSLQGRGAFNKRFEYNPDDPPSKQIASVIKASSDGIIGALETSEIVNAIAKLVTVVEVEELKKEFAELKKLMRKKK
jgi:hypothetical protein